MSDHLCSWLSWMPVLGTLLGATLGFAASFVVAWFNQRKSELTAKSDRRRTRLEELYRTLVEIRKDYQGTLHQIFAKVHDNTPIAASTHVGVPPIINVDMLVKLYFPELADCFNKFDVAKNVFGSQLADAIVVNTTSLLKKEKQVICSKFLNSYEKIDNSITYFQKEISRVIDA